jgi:lipopolysaccharide biosynthesis regulator YciM
MKKPCRKSGKVKYDTHEQAAVAAGERITSDQRYSKKHSFAEVLWTYHCPHCNKWHLTSKSP